MRPFTLGLRLVAALMITGVVTPTLALAGPDDAAQQQQIRDHYRADWDSAPPADATEEPAESPQSFGEDESLDLGDSTEMVPSV